MLTKVDAHLQEYDARVGSSLQMISADAQGRISVEDLEKALTVIKHRPDDEVIQAVIQKLDVDQDGYVELEHVLGLIREEGLGKLICSSMECMSVSGCLWRDSPRGRYRGGRRGANDYRTGQGAQEGLETPKRGHRPRVTIYISHIYTHTTF